MIDLNSTDGLGYCNRGEVYEEIGGIAKAEADFAKAKDLGYEPEDE